MFPILLSLSLTIPVQYRVIYTDDMTFDRLPVVPIPARQLELTPAGRLAPSVTIPALQALLKSLQEKNDPKNGATVKALQKIIDDEMAEQKKSQPKK